nr:hypothetical protein [Tanacetum cinerariifolium]
MIHYTMMSEDSSAAGSPGGIVMQPRDKRDEEFTDAENLKELCDIQASNILSQGLPRWIFNTLNQTHTAEEIWESLELLMKGSGQTLDRRKEDLFDEYECFRANDNELIEDYFVRFHKLINDMKVTKLTIPTHQINTNFVNNLPRTGVSKENGAVLDAEAEAFLADVECTIPLDEPLALATTNMFQVNHEDAYDLDVDDEPNAAATFMANLSSSSSQINEVRTFNDNIFETVSPSWLSEVPQDEHLDTDDDSVHEDYTIPYDQYLATKESQDVPTEASLIPPTAAYMLQTLIDLTIQVEGHRKVNQEQALVNATLSAELDQCKLELARLERNKVQLECDQVIVARNNRNAKLEQETELLKTTLRNKEVTITRLTSETKTVLSKKKTLEEIVCLKNANQVATGLGLSNLWFGRKAQLSQPTLYDGHRLLQPSHAPVTVSDSHETLLETEFFPQKEISREQVYWLSASDIASQSSDPPKPVTPFVHTRPMNSESANSNATPSNAIFEVNKLKDQLQERDETIRNLESQFSIS